MKVTEPYNARQHEGDPPTIYCGDTVAFYHSHHDEAAFKRMDKPVERPSSSIPD